MNKFNEMFWQYKYFYLACIMVFFIAPLSVYVFGDENLNKIISVCYMLDVIVMSVTAFMIAAGGFIWYYPLVCTAFFVISVVTEGIVPLEDDFYFAMFLRNAIVFTAMTYIAAWAGVSYRKLRLK